VTVARPIERPVTDYVELTGSTQATAKVDLRARVNGYLQDILFEDGATVQKGELLFRIDEKPFRAALESARAKLAEAEARRKASRESRVVQTAEAALQVTRSQATVAQLDEARGRRLLERGAQTREEYDRHAAALKTAQADVEVKEANLEQARVEFESNIALTEASVANAQAAVTNAELDLSYTEIRAPIGGRIGRRLVDPGNLVQAETTLLATIEAFDPIYVYFTVSESQVLYFARLRQQHKLPPLGTEPIILNMGLGDEEGFPHEGLFDFGELGVDPDTGTALRRGIFPNPGGTIVPGLFARVRAAVGSPSPRLLVPERALGADQQGRYALVVNAKDVVEQRPVRTGTEVGGLRVIEEGLKPDDWVVIDGLLRARPGARVAPERGEIPALATARDGPGPQTTAAPVGPTDGRGSGRPIGAAMAPSPEGIGTARSE
jgi:membrane fusion protein (multidrug efflux system)